MTCFGCDVQDRPIIRVVQVRARSAIQQPAHILQSTDARGVIQCGVSSHIPRIHFLARVYHGVKYRGALILGRQHQGGHSEVIGM